jgi:diguanylate cyclase
MTRRKQPDVTTGGDTPGEQALAALERMGIEATPQSFAVFHDYYSGGNAALKAAIDGVLARGQHLTTEACDELHDRFLTNAALAALVPEASLQLADMIGKMTDIVSHAGADTRSFGRQLQAFAGEAGQAPSGPSLALLIQRMLAHTQETIARVDLLERRLDEARGEITELRGSVDRIQREAMTDPLTGLGNRRAFEARLAASIREARKRRRPLSILLCDLDNFKRFNDTWGHLIGDLVLKLFAKVLSDSIKGRDTPARFGGEEFAVILPETPLAGATRLAEKIRQELENKRLVKKTTGDDLGKITVSIGCATLTAKETAAEFVNRADKALYGAKGEGRNRVSQA